MIEQNHDFIIREIFLFVFELNQNQSGAFITL